jgi:transcriptional regulator with XRE-family HTH domain
MQKFGEKLRTLRQQQGLSQRELAEALGYVSATGYISDFEKGKRKPTLDFALKVADYFRVTVDVLVRDEEDLPPGG